MTLRYLAVVVLLAAVGAGVLGMRQQQLNDKHAMAESHAEMKEAREHIKDLQAPHREEDPPRRAQRRYRASRHHRRADLKPYRTRC